MNDDYLLRVRALEFAMETMEGASTARIVSTAKEYYEFLSSTEKETEKSE